MSKQIAVCLVAIAALAIVVQATPAARQDTMKPVLVKTIVDKKLGRVLTTRRQAGDLRLEQGAEGQDPLHRRLREGLAARAREERRRRAHARHRGSRATSARSAAPTAPAS